MKFRFYQLFPVAVIALLVWAMIEPLMRFTEPGGEQMLMSNFKLLSHYGEVSWSVIALGIVLIFATIVNLFTFLVSFFSNFELMKRSSILSMLLIAGYYIVLLIYSLILLNGVELEVDLPMLFPLFALVLNMVFVKLVSRTEASIIAKASGFRLRD
ncbi:MAG: hypothetical protein IKJ61_03155 [Bacteroidaceae bacterium]|nr:hypothetical protein [Bacteroidaceae bacterium]MBR3907082.1 hypothetical protein [Bacteroidaceae bacterium]